MKISLSTGIVALAAQNANNANALSLVMSTNVPRSVAFRPPPDSVMSLRMASPAATVAAPAEFKPAGASTKSRKLGLITFDLDDSLYAVQPVLREANEVFVEKMAQYGYEITRDEVLEAGARVRREAGQSGASMSHTEVRLLAIRREMERKMLERKLAECASDWATEVESLTGPVRESAATWARTSVTESIVESIYSAWERERHHSAERNLYPDVVPALQKIRERHPDCVIGAVTDGRANPLLMVFTLAPYFDFCMSWEDDAASRVEFFKELGSVDGAADLQWIYKAARERYEEIAASKRGMRMDFEEDVAADGRGGGGGGDGEEEEEPAWIHVGDDLAYDVGGAASCGARTVLLDLDDEYGQTAKLRFSGPGSPSVAWSTASEREVAVRTEMCRHAEDLVDRRVKRLSVLPDAVDEILRGE